jgi:hypothetical protein
LHWDKTKRYRGHEPLFYVLGLLLLLLLPLLPGFLELVSNRYRGWASTACTPATPIFCRQLSPSPECAGAEGAGLQNYWNARLASWSVLLEKNVEEEVLSTAGLVIPSDFSFLKEVYCAGDVETHGGVILRSLLAEGDLILGDHNSVVRWASAHHMLIGRNATLFGRMVAHKEMCFRPGQLPAHPGPAHTDGRCMAGGAADGAVPGFRILQLEHTVFFNDDIQRVVVEGNLVVPDHSLVSGHLVVHGTLKIGHGCYIQGSIKASGNVHGQWRNRGGLMVSDMSVSCLNDCILLGPVVAERFVYIGSRSVLGSISSPMSVSSIPSASKLPMVVHGTVWARTRGAIEHERSGA